VTARSELSISKHFDLADSHAPVSIGIDPGKQRFQPAPSGWH
jgi:hypothetical protein